MSVDNSTTPQGNRCLKPVDLYEIHVLDGVKQSPPLIETGSCGLTVGHSGDCALSEGGNKAV